MAIASAFLVFLATFCLSLAAEHSVWPDSSVACPFELCYTLSEYTADPNTYFTSGSNFSFLRGEHRLNTTLTLNGVTGVSLRGDDTDSTIISIATGASIVWNNSQDISVSHLTILYEGSTATSPHTALIFHNTTSVQISNVTFIGVNTVQVYSQAIRMIQTIAAFADCHFRNWHSIDGGAIFTNTSSLVFSGVTTFANNTSDESGGGMYAGNESTVAFSGTTMFLNNNARSLILKTGGGGLYAVSCSVEFDGVSIFERNQPVNASLRLIGISIYVYNASLQILNVARFRENSGKYSGAIEGVEANIFISGQITFSDNTFGGTISIFRSNFTCMGEITFTNNDAFFAGSCMFISRSFAFFDGEVNFINNLAYNSGGGALYGFRSTIQLQGNTSFINNSATGRIGGAIYMESSSLACEGNTTFSNNSVEYRGGGIYGVESTVNFSGIATFSENRAEQGGGLGLEGNSLLTLQLPVLVNFYGNNATSKGGALLVDASDFAECQNATSVERSNCFFQIESANSSISDTLLEQIEATNFSSSEILLNFMQNQASDAGSVLYGGSLQFCQVQVSGMEVDGDDSFTFFRNISNISLAEMTGTVPYISSDPLRVCFCTDGMPDCSNTAVRSVSAHRGQQFSLPVIAVGQGEMPVPTTIQAYIRDFINETELSPQSHKIRGACTNITFRLFTNATNKTLALFPGGSCGNTEVTRRESHVIVTPCPPGFEPMGRECICEKRLTNLSSAIGCDIDTTRIERPGNAWIDPIFDRNSSYLGFILYEDCPLGFCRPQSDRVSFRFLPNNSDIQCSSNRTGRMCGACQNGYSLTLNKFNCKKCSNSWFGLLLFFAFSGIVLIALLLALHMTVAAGTINGLILYANIVNANSLVFFPNDNDDNILTIALRVFISWLNLDFGIETCFYDSLDFYTYAWLNYIFPFYLWFLISAIIFSCNYFPKVGRLFGSNPVAVLATVILMSYTKLLEANVLSLSYATLKYPDNLLVRVWVYDSNLTHFRGKHIFLATAAICILVFLLVPYVLLLLFGFRLQAFSRKKAFLWLNKVKPFLDAYYAPYRKNTRYWPGFMLLVRSCLYLSFSFNTFGNSSANLIAISSVFTAVAVIPWLSNRVYERFYNDLLEASFILNLCLLSSATYHVRVTNNSRTQSIVTYLSIGAAFLEFIGIVCFHVYLRLKGIKFVVILKRCLQKIREIFRTVSEASKEERPSVVTVTTVELRESLLESESSS